MCNKLAFTSNELSDTYIQNNTFLLPCLLNITLYPFGLVLKTILHPSDSPVWCNVFAISYSSSSNTLKESSLSIYDHSFPAPTSYETSQVRIEFSPTNIGNTYHSGADILQSMRRYRINVIYTKFHCLCGFFLSLTSDLK